LHPPSHTMERLPPVPQTLCLIPVPVPASFRLGVPRKNPLPCRSTGTSLSFCTVYAPDQHPSALFLLSPPRSRPYSYFSLLPPSFIYSTGTNTLPPEGKSCYLLERLILWLLRQFSPSPLKMTSNCPHFDGRSSILPPPCPPSFLNTRSFLSFFPPPYLEI